MLFLTSASTLRSFPLRLGCTIVTITIACCHTIGCHRLAYPSRCCFMRLSTAFTRIRCQIRFPTVSRSLTQPQGLEPSPSPLHSQAVSNLSMPVAPLGFSGIGSPIPWQCAFVSVCSDQNSAGRSNISARLQPEGYRPNFNVPTSCKVWTSEPVETTTDILSSALG